MKENEISVVTAFPRQVREIENTFITLADGIKAGCTYLVARGC